MRHASSARSGSKKALGSLFFGSSMPVAEEAVRKEEPMKKTWKKPAMCTVAVGMEMSRYFPAQLAAKK